MAKQRTSLARLVMMLLPGFMFVGLLAPAAVTVKPKAEEPQETASSRNVTPRRPLYVPRGINSPELVAEAAVEPLFTGARYVAAPHKRRKIQLPQVAAGEEVRDDGIVLAQRDDGQDYVSDAMFDQSVDRTVLAVDFKPTWDPALYDRIPGPIASGSIGFTMWDDFHGDKLRFTIGVPASSTVIPEPQSGGLLGLGLLALALHARRRA